MDTELLKTGTGHYQVEMIPLRLARDVEKTSCRRKRERKKTIETGFAVKWNRVL